MYVEPAHDSVWKVTMAGGQPGSIVKLKLHLFKANLNDCQDCPTYDISGTTLLYAHPRRAAANPFWAHQPNRYRLWRQGLKPLAGGPVHNHIYFPSRPGKWWVGYPATLNVEAYSSGRPEGSRRKSMYGSLWLGVWHGGTPTTQSRTAIQIEIYFDLQKKHSK